MISQKFQKIKQKSKSKTINQSSKTMSSSEGMTLVEIIVALGLLVAIMFFMSSSQLSAIKMNHKTGEIREITQAAEQEMANRRQITIPKTITASFTDECSYEDDEELCMIKIHPCRVDSGNDTIACIDTDENTFPTTEEAIAHQIVVDMFGPVDERTGERRSIRLQTIVEASQ